MRNKILAKTIAMLLGAIAALGQSDEAKTLREAWAAWGDGEVARARDLAQAALALEVAPDEARHLLFLTSYVSGRYEEALAHHGAISPGYRQLAEMNEPVLEAYLHLERLAEALQFARGRKGIPDSTVKILERHLDRPLEVELSGIAVVPFAHHPMTEYFPGFQAEINGSSVIAHVDTGGSFLHMGPARAKALGIEMASAGRGAAHLDLAMVDFSHGIADRFALGAAELRNVPVMVLDSLVGENDFIIFGTNVLERFLSTLDYPSRRLILTKRGDEAAAAEHLKLLPPESARVPFYLWGDHFMFARGSIGEHRDLNFFVDSGLAVVHQTESGEIRQAALTSSKRQFKKWGIGDAEIRKGSGFIESPGALGLGPLTQEGHIFVAGRAGDQNFGGVRIDGLISHAFLKRYAWTIDFDAHEYRFAEPIQ